MANNRLTDKIDDYSIEWGIQFDDTWVPTNPPAQFGTIAPVATANWTYDNLNNGISSESTIGPFPGQGSWRFTTGGGNTTGRIQHGSTASAQSWHPLIESQNYTYGFWIKVNSFPNFGGAVGVVRILNTLANGAPSPWYRGLFFGIGKDLDPASPTYLNNTFAWITQGVTTVNPTAITPQTDKWYYVAFRKVKDDTTNTVTVDLYLNGEIKATVVNPDYPELATFANWGFNNSNPTFALDFNIANVHLAPSSVLDHTAIQAIWDAGAPIQVPVRHYDGTNWVDSSDQKIWDGSKWIPMYANIWNGTSWVAL